MCVPIAICLWTWAPSEQQSAFFISLQVTLEFLFLKGLQFAEYFKVLFILCPACASSLLATVNMVHWQEATLVKGGLRYHQLDILCIWRCVYSLTRTCFLCEWGLQTHYLWAPNRPYGSAGVSFGDHRKNLKMEGGFFFSFKATSQPHGSEVCQ